MGCLAENDERLLVARALDGEREAIQALRPVVQKHVVRALRSQGSRLTMGSSQDVQDFVQEVFLQLFKNGGKKLRRWDPEKGVSLGSFLRWAANDCVLGEARVKRRHEVGLFLGKTEGWESGEPAPGPSSEAELVHLETASRLWARLSNQLSPQGKELMQRLWGEQQSVAQVCAETGLSEDAVYQWRKRLRHLAQRAAQELGLLEVPLKGQPAAG